MSHSELVKLVICSLLILIAGAHIPIHMAPTLATFSLSGAASTVYTSHNADVRSLHGVYE